MTKREAFNGKPYAGNPHVRFDEGEAASTTPRRGSLLYTKVKTLGLKMRITIVFAAIAFLGKMSAEVLVPDPSTIPEPSASSVFYFVTPTPRQGHSSVSAGMTGLASARQERMYRCAFGTRLTSCPPGLLLILQ